MKVKEEGEGKEDCDRKKLKFSETRPNTPYIAFFASNCITNSSF